MQIFFLLAAALLLGSGCSRKSNATAPLDPAPAAAQKTYLALGDSYTIGQSVGETERFPYLLAARLRDSGLRVAMPRYIARTGWTTDELQAAIAGSPDLATYDIVTLLIGVNDQYRGRDTALYRPRFTQLLQKAVELAGGQKSHVFVLSIPDYSATPYVPTSDKPRVSQEIDSYNRINRQITESFGISYTDITPDTRAAATDATLLANDGLHYSGKEHGVWAGRLVSKVFAVLR